MEKTELIQDRNRWKILSGSWLKLIAVTSMIIDHVAAFYCGRMPYFQHAFFTVGSRPVTLYLIMRCIGRIAFPLFAFLIVEGFMHTRSRFRYGLNLFIFALISEIPWNLVHTGTWFCPRQNVFFTLFLGLIGLCAIERFKDNRKLMSASLIGLLVLSFVLRADYGCTGYGFILLLYALRDKPLIQAIIGSCILPGRLIPGFAFIPINMYNGERGFIKGKVLKYLFYAFYPVHLLVLYFLVHLHTY